jgi:hypothetical protein
MDEPTWRRVLCWGAVVTFFAMPLIALTFHVIAIQLGWKADERVTELKGLLPVYYTVSSLVFGLAGLNTFDRFNGKKGPGP